MKGKIIIKLKAVKSAQKDLPDFGLGKGVLATQEVDFPGEFEDEFDKSVLHVSIGRLAQDLIDDVIETKFEKVK